MTETVNAVAFGLLALAAVGGAIGVLSSRNVVHAAFWLLEFMLAVAGLFLLLSAEFLALVQVLVYAGAVSVLLLFVVMLTLRRREDAIRPADASLPAAALATLFGGMVFLALARFVPTISPMPDAAPDIAALGMELFTKWVLPFEVASLVLLVALVGAVWWSKEVEE
ncbi:MAG: NADH-quinone oxidoreductase subunit J [Coriobacteriia bacterium]|nr:NADH-quinone oxidoreductase subunit J [Coriobacteriia bacterium]